MSNFDIMNWVKELKIKNVDGVFNKGQPLVGV